MAAHLPSIARSAYRLSLYDEVVRQRARRTIGYFGLLVTLISLAMTVAATVHLRRFLLRDVEPILDEIPVVVIKDGEASANVPQPWVRTFPTDQGFELALIIDTTGKITALKPDQSGLLLTRTQLHLRDARKNDDKAIELATVGDYVFDARALWDRHLDRALWYFFAGCFVFLLFYYTAAKLLHALLLSVAGLIANATRGRPLRYGAVFTVSIYALTPAILLDVGLNLAGLSLPHFWLVYLGLGILYTVLGVRAVADGDPAAPPAP